MISKLTWDKRSNWGFQMYISRFRRFIVPIPPEILILETLTVSMTDRSKTIISSDQHNWLHVTNQKSADTKSSKRSDDVFKRTVKKSIANISNRSPTSQTCHQDNCFQHPSPTSMLPVCSNYLIRLEGHSKSYSFLELRTGL